MAKRSTDLKHSPLIILDHTVPVAEHFKEIWIMIGGEPSYPKVEIVKVYIKIRTIVTENRIVRHSREGSEGGWKNSKERKGPTKK